MMMVMMSTMMLTATLRTLTQSWPAYELPGRPATRSHMAVSFAFSRPPTTSERQWSGAALRPLLRPQLLSGLLLGIFSSLGTELSRPTLGISTSLEENILLAEKLSFRTYCDPRIETQC